MKNFWVDFTVHDPYNNKVQKYYIGGVSIGDNMIVILKERVQCLAARNVLITELVSLTREIFGSQWKPIIYAGFPEFHMYAWSEKQKMIAGIQYYNYSGALVYNVHSEPKFYVDHRPFFYSYVDMDDNITVGDKNKGTKIEVLKINHQLSQIDRMRVLSYNANTAVAMLLLFDIKERVSMTGKATLSSGTSLNWEVVEVCKYDIPSSEPLLDFDVILGKVYAYTKNYVYAPNKHFCFY